ncbi:MAG: amidohydrolase family protein, partial [Oscillospiraceae bacterium]|nr:amidohydrolase family protein [Oscillospiraceae bacterium]
IVDAHSHTRTKKSYYENGPYDLFSLNSYFERDITGLVTGTPYAGCSSDEERWDELKGALDKGRNITYWRHNIATYQKLYGFSGEDLNDGNWRELNELIKSNSLDKDWYDRVTRKVCRIVTQVRNIPWFDEWLTADLIAASDADILDAAWFTEWEPEYFTGLLRMECALFLHRIPMVEKLSAFTGVAIDDLSSLEEALYKIIDIYAEKGVVGIKLAHAYFRTLESLPEERSDIERIFATALSGGGATKSRIKSLQDYIIFFLAGVCDERDLLFQIHTGIQHNWANIADANPLHLTPLLSAFPGVRFDLLHAGIPFIHESAVLGKLFHNTHMNMAWTYVISMAASRQALSECIDLVPGHRILAFGSDVKFPELICGHLEMAFSCVADVLANKVCDDFLSRGEALSLIDKMFVQNPTELYRLRHG